MLRRAGRLQTAPSAWVADESTHRIRAVLPWRALAAGALLALALGAALYAGLSGGSASRTAARSHEPEALAAAGPAYRIDASAAGLSAANPAQHLSTSFASAGVTV